MENAQDENLNPSENREEPTEDIFNLDDIGEDLTLNPRTSENPQKSKPLIEKDDFGGQDIVEKMEMIQNAEKKSSSFAPSVVLEDEFAYFRSLAEKVVASKLTPRGVDTVEKVIVILQTGKELGLSGMAALNNIHVIEGRPTLGIHAVNSLVKRAGVDYTTIRDYEPVYKKVVQGDKEVEGIVDYVTEIKFFRKSQITGSVIEEVVRYSFKDAQTAGLTTKSNWKSYPKLMLWNRCFVIGARRVAPDALLGMYEMSEMADVHNISYQVEEVN